MEKGDRNLLCQAPEGPFRQKVPVPFFQSLPAGSKADADTAVIVEVEELEIHQKRVEILDAYNNMKLVTVIELLSPTNKRPGPGRESYRAKQQEILARDCHLVEIDLLRVNERVLSIPMWRLHEFEPFYYVVSVNRWPHRNRFEIYARVLKQRLPRVAIPLADPDPDVRLDLQAALEQVYVEGRYARRLRYDEPCEPALKDEHQQWASDCLNAYQAEGS